ncbi:efflux RND transporter periplasmic adaptor subunit [Methylicorpusculum sp.]|uniref:efflux RND transporter periplasmic adaptor subunit n=1 Tax=Methylicorpusculum sp. TaxID=2713644 RepID=UPI0027311459|nr:efflux RND transporter periplasmic adaptor subunit [Methylicorpusculum sp.]MDP2180662.1 efflux RND transporter periplasmic adaptor subunit [Methylicorpusculum sp.]MDP3530407.1 efflux RND transporter periplasmic adaptor subunit [Methylicorpusculum sp.]MDZ4152813.1 efflux RND transporter periplasmic adaptor subunit [Methylicorpusculum sp.]
MANVLRKLFKALPSLVIIAIAGSLSYYWLTNKPRAARQPAAISAPLVEVITPPIIDHSVTVSGLGNVVASQSVNLNSQVDGMVKSVSKNFIEGGLLREGEEIVKLDPTDYELRLRQAQNDLIRAKFNLKLELGQQAIAQQEYKLLGQELDELASELVQRKPHLEASKSALDAAEAALEQAKLNLQRTRTIAPFNAVVTARNANIGSWVSTFSTGTPLVQLVATDTFWIDVSLSLEKLRWIHIPGFNNEQGSTVEITYSQAWGPEAFRIGKVKRLKAEVEPQGRMAKLIVEVEDPLGLKPANRHLPHMMLGTLVHAAIAGKSITRVMAIPENALHDGNRLWLMTPENTLDIIKVEPLWTEPKWVYLSAETLPPSPRIIISDLPAPVQNMQIRTHEPKTSEPAR